MTKRRDSVSGTAPSIADIKNRRIKLKGQAGISLDSAFRRVDEAVASFQSLRDIFQTASQRVGASSTSRLKWLVEFIAQPNFEPGGDTPMEICAFSAPIAERDSVFDTSVADARLGIKAAQLRKLAKRVREGIEAVVTGGTWFEGPLTLMHELGSKARRVNYSGRLDSVFLAAAIELVGVERARLRKCPLADCGRIFVRSQRAEYCSRRCSTNARYARWRKKHFPSKGAFSKWRHDRYKKKVRQRQSGAIVQRRQRRARHN